MLERDVRWMGAAILLAALGACARGDFATITLVYQPAALQNSVPNVERPARQRIVAAFNAYASTHGYKCHSTLKRVEEITCRGPRDMNVTFAPELNRHAYTARFNWLEIGGRSRNEFERLTTEFERALQSTLTDVEVWVVHERT